MIKFSYSIKINCRACNQIINTNEMVAITQGIDVGSLENLIDVSDNYSEAGWKLGMPFISYNIDKNNNKDIFREINIDQIIKFPSKFPKEIQDQLYTLRNQLNSGEYHLKCYSESLRKLSQLLEMKAFA